MNRSQKTEGLFQPQTLDVDETIMDKSLRIVDDLPVAPKIHNAPILPSDRTLPVVQVTPNPGLCVKTKNLDGVKVFINLCKILEIPPPPPLSEEKLQDIIANEDYGTDFRVPMSLGSPRNEKDKSGGACLACDVAINSVWFDDVMFDSITFTTFVVNVAMEGLCEKYGDQVNLDRQKLDDSEEQKVLGDFTKTPHPTTSQLPWRELENQRNGRTFDGPENGQVDPTRVCSHQRPVGRRRSRLFGGHHRASGPSEQRWLAVGRWRRQAGLLLAQESPRHLSTV